MATHESHHYDQLNRASFEAVIASMAVVHNFQIGNDSIERLGDKDDHSILTRVDQLSEQAAKVVLANQFPDVPILGEETGRSSEADSGHLFLIDPIDGTRPFLLGAPTSTVIGGLYDISRRQIVSATIGEPATGRIWHAANGQQTRLTHIDPATSKVRTFPIECQVWDGDIRDNATVLVDNFKTFSRATNGGKRPVLTNLDLQRLFGGLQSRVVIQNYGSNGLHHALVAGGGETMAGSITTSMGGEWDTPGALAVMCAGGAAEGLRITDARRLVSVDPLDPFDYDMLITANNPDSLAFLRQNLAVSL